MSDFDTSVVLDDDHVLGFSTLRLLERLDHLEAFENVIPFLGCGLPGVSGRFDHECTPFGGVEGGASPVLRFPPTVDVEAEIAKTSIDLTEPFEFGLLLVVLANKNVVVRLCLPLDEVYQSRVADEVERVFDNGDSISNIVQTNVVTELLL